ncbi:MAG: hypothetical protein KA821_07010 [Chitinophagaceae bacterium]|nr:hypothetical protein [Chitinophagaceae bacterium]
MNALLDKSANAIAYINNNIIFLPDGHVAGVILGHCVFGRSGSVAGKLFDQTFYATNGEIIARLQPQTTKETGNTDLMRRQAWELIQIIKDHECPWIIPQNKWAAQTITALLN